MAELSIEKFKSRFDNGARANRFGTHFMCPKLGINVEGVLCKNASLPGRQLDVTDWSAYGPTNAYPTNVSHDGQRATFTFLCDSSFAEKQVFESWMTFIYGVTPDGSFDHTNPKMQYMVDYAGQVNVMHYRNNAESADASTKVVTLHDAFPVDMNAQAMDYDSVDTVLQMTIIFAFRHFTTEYKEIPEPTALQSFINTGRQVLDIATDVASIGSTLGIPGADRVRRVANSANTATGAVSKIESTLGTFEGLLGP